MEAFIALTGGWKADIDFVIPSFESIKTIHFPAVSEDLSFIDLHIGPSGR